MTIFEFMCREAVDGEIPPASFIRSPRKVLFWRAIASGKQYSKHSAAAEFGWNERQADLALGELYKSGKAHIVGWTRNGDRGPKTRIIAFGPGEDAPPPERLSNAFICLRWRERHPERHKACDRNGKIRRMIRRGTLPTGNDPLLFAIMGIAA